MFLLSLDYKIWDRNIFLEDKEDRNNCTSPGYILFPLEIYHILFTRYKIFEQEALPDIWQHVNLVEYKKEKNIINVCAKSKYNIAPRMKAIIQIGNCFYFLFFIFILTRTLCVRMFLLSMFNGVDCCIVIVNKETITLTSAECEILICEGGYKLALQSPLLSLRN